MRVHFQQILDIKILFPIIVCVWILVFEFLNNGSDIFFSKVNLSCITLLTVFNKRIARFTI